MLEVIVKCCLTDRHIWEAAFFVKRFFCVEWEVKYVEIVMSDLDIDLILTK